MKLKSARPQSEKSEIVAKVRVLVCVVIPVIVGFTKKVERIIGVFIGTVFGLRGFANTTLARLRSKIVTFVRILGSFVSSAIVSVSFVVTSLFNTPFTPKVRSLAYARIFISKRSKFFMLIIVISHKSVGLTAVIT